ncbi:MAG: helix-turn-helix transcriptional regulator, partial [Deltaproteobacteria bacterium]|nr:helix-turn-helix transcriptional regulator [Deltaproteobacteria bacterium]
MEDGRLWTIGFTRGENKEPFDKKESEFIELLLPHINRAINLGYLLQQQTEPGEQKLFWPLVSLVDGITWGVLLLDDEAKPVYMNRAAEKLLAKEDGLKICQEKISAILPERDLALQDMIQAAIGYPDDLYKVRIGGTIRINRKKSDYPLIVSASPFRPQHINQAPAGSSVIVVISSPEQYSHPSAEVLRELFGLTKAESRLAVELGKGDTLDQISLRMGIKKSTVRSQLLSIFQKTGSKRQADLVRLFGSCVIATNGMSHFMKTPEKALMAVP